MCNCDGLIPLSVFGLDYEPPVTGWGGIDAEIVEDDIGRPSIGREDAARLIGARRAAAAYADEQAARREAESRARFLSEVPAGIPAVEGLTSTEQMFELGAADRPKKVSEELLEAQFAGGR